MTSTPPPLLLAPPVAALVQRAAADVDAHTKNADADRPYVTLTFAQSLDGSVTSTTAHPLLLSCSSSMALTHTLRAMHAGILVGVNTVKSDDPRLNVRLVAGESPVPIIVDSALRVPVHSRCLQRPSIIVCNTNDLPASIIDNDGCVVSARVMDSYSGETETKLCRLYAILTSHPHCEIIALSPVSSTTQQMDWALIFRSLYRVKHVRSIMVEGGAAIIQSLLHTLAASTSSDCDSDSDSSGAVVDSVLLTVAPVFVGGVRPLSSLLSSFPRLHATRVVQCGDDAVIHGFTRPFTDTYTAFQPLSVSPSQSFFYQKRYVLLSLFTAASSIIVVNYRRWMPVVQNARQDRSRVAVALLVCGSLIAVGHRIRTLWNRKNNARASTNNDNGSGDGVRTRQSLSTLSIVTRPSLPHTAVPARHSLDIAIPSLSFAATNENSTPSDRTAALLAVMKRKQRLKSSRRTQSELANGKGGTGGPSLTVITRERE